MVGGALTRIKAGYDSLSRTHKEIADYILNNATACTRLSITELGKRLGCSKTAILRFCRAIGYEGYRSLRTDLIGDVGEQLHRIHDMLEPTDGPDAIALKVCRANARAAQETARILHTGELEKAAETLLSASRIKFFATGGSAVVALDAYQKFLRLGLICLYPNEERLQGMLASLCQPGEVGLGISLSGATRSTVMAMQTARQNGATTIGITGGVDSPITRFSDIYLYGAHSPMSHITGTIETRTALLSVVDSLFMLMVSKRLKSTEESLEKTQRVIENDRFDERMMKYLAEGD
ncbi:MAG TPA: MurR/RpiR family transcriptional regulator [Clostridia bacterium]|nr:MurR/RpiR family transcriptional regulator [Clostridia bacterium]